jgi:hypothetical protein
LLELQLVQALATVSRAVESACTPVFQDLNLTHLQFMVVVALREKSPRSGREIVELLPDPGTFYRCPCSLRWPAAPARPSSGLKNRLYPLLVLARAFQSNTGGRKRPPAGRSTPVGHSAKPPSVGRSAHASLTKEDTATRPLSSTGRGTFSSPGGIGAAGLKHQNMQCTRPTSLDDSERFPILQKAERKNDHHTQVGGTYSVTGGPATVDSGRLGHCGRADPPAGHERWWTRHPGHTPWPSILHSYVERRGSLRNYSGILPDPDHAAVTMSQKTELMKAKAIPEGSHVHLLRQGHPIASGVIDTWMPDGSAFWIWLDHGAGKRLVHESDVVDVVLSANDPEPPSPQA